MTEREIRLYISSLRALCEIQRVQRGKTLQLHTDITYNVPFGFGSWSLESISHVSRHTAQHRIASLTIIFISIISQPVHFGYRGLEITYKLSDNKSVACTIQKRKLLCTKNRKIRETFGFLSRRFLRGFSFSFHLVSDELRGALLVRVVDLSVH